MWVYSPYDTWPADSEGQGQKTARKKWMFVTYHKWKKATNLFGDNNCLYVCEKKIMNGK